MDIAVYYAILTSMFSFIHCSQNRHCKFRFDEDGRGYCIAQGTCPGATLSGLCPKGDPNLGCCLLEHTPSYPNIQTNFTYHLYISIFNNTLRSKHLYKPFINSLKEADVRSCHQQAAFSALDGYFDEILGNTFYSNMAPQWALKSGFYHRRVTIINFPVPAGRLAVVAFDTTYLKKMEAIPKDDESWRYTGRGIFHIPGKNYYQWINKTLKKDIIDQPELLAFPSLAFESASAVWKYSYTNIPVVKPVNYNYLVDGSRYNFQLLSYYMRGHLSGIDELINIWNKINKILKCDCASSSGPTCKVNGRQGQCKIISDCKGSQISSSQQCPGPPSVAQCCLACSSSVNVYLVIDNTIPNNSWLSAIVSNVLQNTALTASQAKIIHFGDTKQNIFRSERLANLSFIQKNDITNVIKYIQEDIKVTIGSSKRTSVVMITENNTLVESIPNKLDESQNGIKVKFVALAPTSDQQLSVNYFTSNKIFQYGVSNKVDQLLEHICSGPWDAEPKQRMCFTLRGGEKIYLGLPVQSVSNNLGIIVHNDVGETFVDGVPTMQHLPGQQNDRCSRQSVNTESHQPLVNTVLLTIFGKKIHKIQSIVVNGRLQVTMRGIKDINSLSLRIVSATEVQKLQPSMVRFGSIVMVGCIAAMICCFLTFVTLIIAINISKRRRLSCDNSIPQIKITSAEENGHSHAKLDRKVSASSCTSTTVLLKDKKTQSSKCPRSNCITALCPCCSYCMENVRKPYDRNQHRSIKIQNDAQLFKVVFVFLFNLVLIIGMHLTSSKVKNKIICSLLTYFGSAVYSWSLLEVAVTIYIGKGNTLRRRLFPYTIALGAPFPWSIIPCLFVDEQISRFWLSWNDKYGWIIPGILFFILLSLISVSISLCASERCQSKGDGTINFKRSYVFLLSVFLLLFSLTLALLVSSITWPNVSIFQYLFAVSNTSVGTFTVFTFGMARKEVKAPVISAVLYILEKVCSGKKESGKNSLAVRIKDRFLKEGKQLEEPENITNYNFSMVTVNEVPAKRE